MAYDITMVTPWLRCENRPKAFLERVKTDQISESFTYSIVILEFRRCVSAATRLTLWQKKYKIIFLLQNENTVNTQSHCMEFTQLGTIGLTSLISLSYYSLGFGCFGLFSLCTSDQYITHESDTSLGG